MLGLRLENLENQILLAHAGRAGDVQILGDLGELLNAHVLQVVDVEGLSGLGLTRRVGAVRGWRGLTPAA